MSLCIKFPDIYLKNKIKLNSPSDIYEAASDVRLLISHIDLFFLLRRTFNSLSLDVPVYPQTDIQKVILEVMREKHIKSKLFRSNIFLNM